MEDPTQDIRRDQIHSESSHNGGIVLPAENQEQNMDDEMVEVARSKRSDASMNESMAEPLLSPTQSARNHDFDSKRKFRIEGLKYPGSWRKNEKLQDILARADRFHMMFEKKKDGIKQGGISLTFDCPEAARNAFQEGQKIVVDGVHLKLMASKAFYQTRRPNESFTVPEDPKVRDRTLYALHILETTTDSVLETIFSDMESVEILPLEDRRNQAEILMQSKEAADSAKEDADGFELNDGETCSVIKVLTPSEYVDYIARSVRAPALILSPTPSASSSLLPPLSRSNSNASSCSKPSLASPAKIPMKEEKSKEKEKPVEKIEKPVPAPLPLPTEIPEVEPEISEISAIITSIVNDHRINWAELNEREELYELADKASYSLGGVRDELLVEGLLTVMEAARGEAEESSWMRRHLDGLIKLWKKEVASEVSFARPTRVPLQARKIAPIPKEKKKRARGGGGADARVQFGIGAILAAARAKFVTEEGELDIEEADDGNIMIGDVPLSFESWARFNKQPLKRAVQKEEKSEANRENRKVKRAKMEEEKKKKKEEDKKKKEAEKPAKELEEGEMDSDSDGGEERKGKKEEESSSSSSESDVDEDDVDGANSRRRRNFRRKNDRNKPPSLPPLFQSIYDNRVSIISQLAVEHRVAFSKVLTTFVNQKGGIDSKQEQALRNYMNNFGR